MDETEFEKLEIDNWVLHKRLPKQISKKVYKPGDIAFVEFKNESGIASRNDISPIPLSNTILLKNGFIFDSLNNLYSENNGKISVSIALDPILLIGDGATTIEGNNNNSHPPKCLFCHSSKKVTSNPLTTKRPYRSANLCERLIVQKIIISQYFSLNKLSDM